MLGTAEPRLRLPQPLFVQPVKKMFCFIIEMFIEKITQNLEQKAKNTLLLDLKTLKVQPHLIDRRLFDWTNSFVNIQ